MGGCRAPQINLFMDGTFTNAEIMQWMGSDCDAAVFLVIGTPFPDHQHRFHGLSCPPIVHACMERPYAVARGAGIGLGAAALCQVCPIVSSASRLSPPLGANDLLPHTAHPHPTSAAAAMLPLPGGCRHCAALVIETHELESMPLM